MQAKFLYPVGGYIYFTNESPKVSVEVFCDSKETIAISGKVTDFYGIETQTISVSKAVCNNDKIEIDINCEKLGYYFVELDIAGTGDKVSLKTGLGYTTPHERSPIPDSCFGISCNFAKPEQHYPLFAKMGIRYLRLGQLERCRDLLEEYGFGACVQRQGYDIFSHARICRYAPAVRNSVYYFEKQFGDVSFYNEHGNEHWEERNLMLLTEWHKVTGLARLEANPSGWFANSGCPGVDLEKLKVMFDNGLGDYITTLSLHAYSFPGAPEGKDSYWSVDRLNDLGRYMKENNINIPVCCTEQGYPALYDQKKCECYSPGEMSTFEGQADYLVRSWIMFLSLGISKVVWFNGPWYDGFGILEKDGPAPWPAAMALCELIRAIDYCDYIGDVDNNDGTYYKVFRNRNTGKLLGVIWHPVYYSRSSSKDKNLSFDGKHTEADGTAQEKFDYQLKYLENDYVVKDIMGNAVKDENGKIVIGESPLYVYNLSEDIVNTLVDKTVFPVKQVVAKPLPPKVILGLSDAWPAAEPFLNSKFKPGETRIYRLRVHNYTDKPLKDKIVIKTPKPFTVDKTEIDAEVKAGLFNEYEFRVKCDDVAPCGEFKIYAESTTTDAYPVYQIAAVYCPVYIKSIDHPICDGTDLILCIGNSAAGEKNINVKLSSYNNDISFAQNEFNCTIGSKQTSEIALKITSSVTPVEPVVNIALSDGNNTASYDVVIPMAYAEYNDNVVSDEMQNKQKFVLSGYNMTMTAADNYTGPALIGTAKPEPLNAYARIEMDDKKVYFHFDIHDDTVVCNKVTRRNNMDSDGVWIRLYKDIDDAKPYRNFCIMPVDQAGQTSGCSVDEVAADILFDSPHTDYDFSKISAKSEVFDDRYTIDVAIDRDSIDMSEIGDSIIANIRVINMNHNDWSKYYDTGKISYKIIK